MLPDLDGFGVYNQLLRENMKEINEKMMEDT